MLVVEKYTSLEYSQKKGKLSNLSAQRLKDLEQSHDEHQKIRDFALGLLDRNGIEYEIVKDDQVGSVNYSRFDAVMSLGGDGTALHAMSYMTDQLFFGVNTDKHRSIGKLTKLNADTLEHALVASLTSDIRIMQWCRLSARVNGEKVPYLAVNEILVGDPVIDHTSHLRICLEDRCADTVGNGILVANELGKGAMYKSFGGRIFKTKGPAYLLLAPYSISGDVRKNGLLKNETLKVIPKREHYKLRFDCHDKRSVELYHGDVVEIGIDEKDRLRVVI